MTLSKALGIFRIAGAPVGLVISKVLLPENHEGKMQGQAIRPAGVGWGNPTERARENEVSGMKTAIYIEDGITQLVITPESEFERSVVNTLRNKETNTKLFYGSFYDCRGGWVRQSSYSPMSSESHDMSLIIVTKTQDGGA